MMDILVGTTNRNKVLSVESYLKGYAVNILTPDDLGLQVQINENGKTPIENAKIKALAYYRASHIPTVAFDSGLYFLDLNDEDIRQPKTHVRRVHGKTLSDEEMIAYYGKLASQFEGRLLAAYRNGCCVVYDEKHIYTYMDNKETARAFAFYLCDKPHKLRTPGWPLDSISIDARSMKYFHDLEKDGDDVSRENSEPKEDAQQLHDYAFLRSFCIKAFHLQ
ncbi:non-canonical purine NTP pyrophosphatase [[Clostridium] innocuum]|nr:non-canonical purine NTP pyrophosphatase [[Clostridium] innocuum]